MKQIIAIGGGGFGRVIKDLKIERYITAQMDLTILTSFITLPNPPPPISIICFIKLSLIHI